jgi:hypothetical protein
MPLAHLLIVLNVAGATMIASARGDLGGKRLGGQSGHAGQSTAQGDGESPPQFGGASVEQYRAGVVVAVRAQRFAELGVVASVPLATRQSVAMRADLAASAGSAPQESAVFHTVNVDGAVRRCGERGEHAGMGGDGLGDALAAAESRADELVGVGPVDLGARRTLGCAACLARDRQNAAELVDGGVAVEQFAGRPVDVIDTAAQQNRLQAPTRLPGRTCGGIGGQRWYSSRRALAGGDERRQTCRQAGEFRVFDQRCCAAWPGQVACRSGPLVCGVGTVTGHLVKLTSPALHGHPSLVRVCLLPILPVSEV